MTDTRDRITKDELAWDAAEVQEGRQPGAVVSVRLGPDEIARVRRLAESAGVTVSQVIRQALADLQDEAESAREQKVYVTAFTYGGTVPITHEHVWHWRGPVQAQLTGDDEASRSGAEPVTSTEPTRVSERVTVAA